MEKKDLTPPTASLWAQVIKTPEERRITEFNKGTPYANTGTKKNTGNSPPTTN